MSAGGIRANKGEILVVKYVHRWDKGEILVVKYVHRWDKGE
jgi:hypothetical protein